MMVRPAVPRDAAAIAAIWNPLIRDTATTFTTEEKTESGLVRDIGAQPFFVIGEAGGVLGFATCVQFRRGPGYAYTMEHSLALAPGARGQGLGRALLARLEAHAQGQGVHAMIAGVSGENPAGVAFHERQGYRKIAVLPEVGYKFGRWMDLVLLQKLLNTYPDKTAQGR